MDEQTLNAAIEKVLRSPLTASRVEFLWHAGEPLAVGLDFYKHASELIRIHNTRHLRVLQSFQTNGTLINGDWCRFFSDEGAHVGVSIDGPEFLHDTQRRNWAERGSHKQAMRGVKLLRQFGVPFGALCVLTRDNLAFPDEMFHFFCENGFESIGFNVEETENANGASSLMCSDRCLGHDTQERYRKFIERVFYLWRHEPNQLAIREFTDMLKIIKQKLAAPNFYRQPDETKPQCIITIQRNGAISTNSPEFSGGHDKRFNDFVFGNINDIEVEEVFENPTYQEFQRAIRSSIQRCADNCVYFDLCGGGFLSNKHAEHGSLDATETVTCKLHRQTLASVVLEGLSPISNL